MEEKEEMVEKRNQTDGTPTGLTQDVGWQIGVSKTLPLPVEAVWEFMSGPEGIALWLGTGAALPPTPEKGTAYKNDAGVTGEIRGYRPGDRIRATHGSSTVQFTVARSGTGQGSVLRFHQEHLASAEEREQQRDHWRAVLASVESALEQRP